MKKTITLLTLSAIAAFTFLSFKTQPSEIITHFDFNPIVDFSGNPPTGKAGNPPNQGSCIDCHIGSIQSATGIIDFTFDNGNSDFYVPGQTYDIELSSNSAIKNGFEMTILTKSDIQKAGSFIDGPNTSTELAQGREYIRHSTSSGINSFKFKWTAPATDVGDLLVFYNYNVSNGNNGSSGDKIYFDEITIKPEGVPAGLISTEKDPFNIFSFWNSEQQELNLNYSLVENSRVVVNLQSLNGQLIQTTDLGYDKQGKYNKSLKAENIVPGIYVVSVFINNRAFNHKIQIQ